jgi:glycosyltransferase involved in cell wall biosynthesis
MQISVVIPTCDRKLRLLSLLRNLDQLSHPLYEVIIVDSGEDKLLTTEYGEFKKFPIHYLVSGKSVCIQRNIGIQRAGGSWIFLCDDDIEIPRDYLEKLTSHIAAYPDTGAVSGLWLQKEKEEWKAGYPENSSKGLFWKYIFQLGIWGEIKEISNNMIIKKIKRHYQKRGNHITKAGWPVITDFSGDWFSAPVYSLGASLIKKEWLLHSPYDEVLDRYGIGDHYGVIADFPKAAVHVLNSTTVYHHQEPANRLQKSLQYYRRNLALDYFIRTKKTPLRVKRVWLVWSLTGSLIDFMFTGKGMAMSAIKSIWKIVTGQNPYYEGAKKRKKIVEPVL